MYSTNQQEERYGHFLRSLHVQVRKVDKALIPIYLNMFYFGTALYFVLQNLETERA
jgi:hypothetical protein